MTHFCEICKKFIFATDALQFEKFNKHYFHKKCIVGLLGFARDASSGTFHCTPCKETTLLKGLSSFALLSRGSVSPKNATLLATTGTESIKEMAASLLGKMSSSETQLRDIPTIKLQLHDLSLIVPHLAALNSKLTATSEALTLSLTELKGQHVALDKHVTALETRPGVGTAQDKLSKFTSRLKALEREKRSSEFILFGIRESPSENLKEIIMKIALILGVKVGHKHIVACFHIPAMGDRPRPLVVKFSSVEFRNRLLEDKRALGVLDDLSGLQPETIDISNCLLSSTHRVFAAARGAVREGRLSRAWIRGGHVFVRRHPDTLPVRLRGSKHLFALTAPPPPPEGSLPLAQASNYAHNVLKLITDVSSAGGD